MSERRAITRLPATAVGMPAEATDTAAPRAVFSIRWIVTGVAVTLTAAAVISVSLVAERNARATLSAEVEARLLLDARNLALAGSSALLGDFPELTLHPLVREMLARQRELSFAVIIDRHGAIQGDADARRLGSAFRAPEELATAAAAVPLADGEALRAGRTLLVASAPVRHPDGRVLGMVHVGLPRAYLDRLIGAARRQQLALLAGFLIVGVVVSFLVVSQLLRPIGALRAGIERIGRGDLDTPVPPADRTELGLLARAINRMSAQLKRAQAEMVERERLGREMELAREIQRSLLPTSHLVAGDCVIEGAQHAATEVGGDYFDVLSLSDGTVGIAVADVAGKGLAGCLVMSMLSALLRACRDSHRSPSALLAALDEQLAETLKPGSFVTMFYGVLDPASGRLTFASAGHNPFIVHRAASGLVESVRSRGIPLGAVRGGAIRRTLADQTIDLAPGDVLLQYTDGINEAFDAGGAEQFGLERMEAVLTAHAAEGPTALLEAMHRAVRAWSGDGPPLDDETMLVVSRSAAALSNGIPAHEPAEPAAADEAPEEAIYERARRDGRRLALTGDLESLEAIHRWLDADVRTGALTRSDADLLTTALYEACANVAEHGLDTDPARRFELWWIPDEAAAPGASRAGARSVFLIRDDGRPFSADPWRGTDFDDPGARRRGRGFGLDIIHRAMCRVNYRPGTPVGNLTVLVFEPLDRPRENMEVRHA